MGYSVKALCYATQEVPGAQVYFQSDWNRWFTFNYYVFLVRGEGRTMLIDCGMDDVTAFNAMLAEGLGRRGVVHPSVREHAVVELLAREGVRPDDVDTVAFTHFHADHVANARLWTNARYLVSAEGWRRSIALRSAWPAMMPDPLFPADLLDFLEEIRETRMDVVEDGPSPVPGLEVHYVGGHTLDSAAFVLDSDEGRIVIPGDTIWMYGNLERNQPVGATANVEQCYAAMAWARLAGDIVVPTHDPAVIERHPGGRISA